MGKIACLPTKIALQRFNFRQRAFLFFYDLFI